MHQAIRVSGTRAALLGLITLVACSSGPLPLSPPASINAQHAKALDYCADGSNALCKVIPTFGSFAETNNTNRRSSSADPQTTFDRQAWQMFIALNWQVQRADDAKTGLSGSGTTVWQSYARREDATSSGHCANPKHLPIFNSIAKSAAQGETLTETTRLIDRHGNWILSEQRYHHLDQPHGQARFVQTSATDQHPPGSQPGNPTGDLEISASWRIINQPDQARHFSIRGLIAVPGRQVRGGEPLCAEVTLGLVGLQITQSRGSQSIRASFEHRDQSPNTATCDPTDPDCYKNIPNGVCHIARSDVDNSDEFSGCNTVTGAGQEMEKNESHYIWDRQPPYAQSYLKQETAQNCKTQVAHCWQVYDSTQKINNTWRAELTAINSVFANYYLVGTDLRAARMQRSSEVACRNARIGVGSMLFKSLNPPASPVKRKRSQVVSVVLSNRENYSAKSRGRDS